MKFLSTRGESSVGSASAAISQGLADDGGLFVPEKFPQADIETLLGMDYAEKACYLLKLFLEEYNQTDLLDACKEAYAKFEDGIPAPVVKIDDKLYITELFHGPTLAFKDIALTILPYLLRTGADNEGIDEEILILVATSGDTGKAALEGFKNQKGVKISVFYPSDGVADMQKLQMSTQEGENVNVVAVKGNFDDCQNAVKKLFSDKKAARELKMKGIVLSSANSINFGRLAPQITYYFSSYCDLVDSGEIKLGDKIDFVVPTGNFGDILAGYYAKKMGLPVNKLICASNSNNVLTEFFASGTYDKNREFIKTVSPSMDILISSNLERLIFEVSGRNSELTASRMNELKEKGKYTVTKEEKQKLSEEFYADYCEEEECFETISDFFEEYGYVLDTHTSVAVNVANKYLKHSGSSVPTVILSTASPYKFTQSVLKALSGKNVKDAFKACESLCEFTACPIPEQIAKLKTKEIRFCKEIDKNGIEEAVMDFIK